MTYVFFTTKTREIWPAAHVAALALVPVSAACAHRQPCRAAAAQLAVLLLKPQRDELTIPPYSQYGDSHCCEVSFGFRLPQHRPCHIFYNARALERVLLPSARPTNLCRAPPCCFPLLLLQPHRASLRSFSRRATCESRRRVLSRSTPPASRWQPLPPRFMPALPPHARAAVLAAADVIVVARALPSSGEADRCFRRNRRDPNSSPPPIPLKARVPRVERETACAHYRARRPVLLSVLARSG